MTKNRAKWVGASVRKIVCLAILVQLLIAGSKGFASTDSSNGNRPFWENSAADLSSDNEFSPSERLDLGIFNEIDRWRTVEKSGGLPDDRVADETLLGADSLAFSRDVVLRGALGSSFSSFQIWGNYYLATGDLKPKNGPVTYDNKLNGAQVGLNVGLGQALLLSGWYNWNDGRLQVDQFDAEAKTTTHLGGVGLRYDSGLLYFTLQGSYGLDSHHLDEPGIDTDFDGWQAGGFFETGFNWETAGGLFTLKPFANYQYNYVDVDANPILGQSTDFDALYQTLGARIDLTCLRSLAFQGRLAWVHQYLDNAPIQNYWFGRVPGTMTPSQLFYEGEIGRDWFWGGAGVRLSLMGTLAVTLDYDCLLNQNMTTHIGSVGLLWSF